MTKEQLGKKTLAQMPINHCLLPTSTVCGWSLSVIIRSVRKPGQHHALAGCWAEQWTDLTYQTLNVKNDLSHFPVPFLTRVITAPTPCRWSLRVRRSWAATSICHCRLVVWFAFWLRGQNFPVLYNQLPDRNAIVLQPTTNGRTSCAIIRR